MNKIYPKILVLSHNSFSNTRNNGKTLESIFSILPKDHLFQLFFNNDNPDFSFCDNYFRITDNDVLKKIFFINNNCGNVVQSNNSTKSDKHSSKTTTNFLYSKASSFKLIRDILWKTNTWKTQSLYKWINDFTPNIIFFVGGNSGFSHNIAVYLSKLYSLPLVTYFTDDYLLYSKPRNTLEVIQKHRIRNFYNKTINHSSLLFAIGDLMADEYTNHFKKKFHPIMNSIPIEPYDKYENKSIKIISYFGGLHLNRWKMIVRLASIIKSPNIVINVYTNSIITDEMEFEFNTCGVIVKKPLEGDELKNEIKKSDILLHVESDDKFNRALTKLSISTKIPEYLMSGRFILGFGPIEVASMRLIHDNGVGMVISSDLSDNDLVEKLDDIISNYELRKEIGLRGYDFAISNFDNSKNSALFMQKINKLLEYES